jgi:lambda family phage portal protein
MQKPRLRIPAGSSAGTTPLRPTASIGGGLGAYGSAYRAASPTAQEMSAWNPGLFSADRAWLPERTLSKARADDLIRNDGAAQSGVEKAADLLVGNQWTLSAQPDGEALGLTPEQTHTLRRAMQREFNRWGSNLWADRRRRLTFPMQLSLAARHYSGGDGEAVGVLGWREEALDWNRARYATCLEVIDPDRLANPQSQPDSDMLRGGIEMDADGAPIAAHFRQNHPGDVMLSRRGAFSTTRVPWETETGRPVVVHWLEPWRAGQSRGISRFAAILAPFKQLSRLGDLELGAAAINAMFAAFIKSGFDPGTVAEALGGSDDPVGQAGSWQDMRASFYENAPVTVSGNRMPILMPGDEIEVPNVSRSTGDFVAFRESFLQTIAAALGISYEQLQADFTKTTYSSARAALNEVFRWVKARRAGLIAQFVAPIYYAVMEEAFDRSYIELPPGAPAFEEAWDLYTRARWIGPARGYIDGVKERQASEIGMQIGVTTGEMEAAEQGGDYEDNLRQMAAEQALRRELGLPAASTAILTGVAPGTQQEPPPSNRTPEGQS